MSFGDQRGRTTAHQRSASLGFDPHLRLGKQIPGLDFDDAGQDDRAGLGCVVEEILQQLADVLVAKALAEPDVPCDFLAGGLQQIVCPVHGHKPPADNFRLADEFVTRIDADERDDEPVLRQALTVRA